MNATHEDMYGDQITATVIPTNFNWKWPKEYKGPKPKEMIEIAAYQAHYAPTILLFTSKQARKIANDLVDFAMVIESREEANTGEQGEIKDDV